MQMTLIEEGGGSPAECSGYTLHMLVARELQRRARRGLAIDWHPLSWDTEKANEKACRLLRRIKGELTTEC
jgi:hypothetical protein